MAYPDILADPTGTLATALALVEDGQAHDAMALMLELHRHILAGGKLPRQWCGEETAAGKLVGEVTDLRKALADWSMTLQEYGAAMLERKDDLGMLAFQVAGES